MLDSFTKRGRIRTILKLLTEERKIILKGPLADLNRIAVRRDKLVEGLLSGKILLVEADLKTIRHEADRNQILLKASLSGIQAAKALLSEQHQAATTTGYMAKCPPLRRLEGTGPPGRQVRHMRI